MPHSKFADVDALMTNAKGILTRIERQYAAALKQQSIPPSLQVDIKNYLGDLRSCLDYVSNRIPGYGRNFPMCEHPNALPKALKGADPAAANVLTKWQPYKNPWMHHFNWLNNEHKHAMLVPQTRTESQQVSVTAPNGGAVTWGPGVIFGAGVSVMGVPIDPRTQMPIPNNQVRTERITWVDFVFSPQAAPPGFPANISVLPLLKVCAKEIPKVIHDVESVIP